MTACVFFTVCNVCCTILGQGNVQAKQVADAMLDAVTDVLSQNTSSTLKTIRVVIFQPPMLKEFYNSMHQREATDATQSMGDKGGFWGSIGSKIKCKYSKENHFRVHIPSSIITFKC